MTDSTPSPTHWNRLDKDEPELHPRRHKPSGTRCRRELQSSFNAVRSINEPKNNASDREENVGHHFTYPQCSTCTDRPPGRLRKFAVSQCSECNVCLCSACTRKHRTNYHGHSISLITTKLDIEEHFVTKNGHHQPVCHEGHKDIPKYFCETCQDVVCLECIQTRHKKHIFFYAKDAYEKHKVALEKNIENAREEANRIMKQLDRGIYIFIYLIVFSQTKLFTTVLA